MKTETKYGFNEAGIPYREKDGSWVRWDTWTGKDYGEKSVYRVTCSGKQDRTPATLSWPKEEGGNIEYSERCRCCFLNISHSVALHELSLQVVAA